MPIIIYTAVLLWYQLVVVLHFVSSGMALSLAGQTSLDIFRLANCVPGKGCDRQKPERRAMLAQGKGV